MLTAIATSFAKLPMPLRPICASSMPPRYDTAEIPPFRLPPPFLHNGQKMDLDPKHVGEVWY